MKKETVENLFEENSVVEENVDVQPVEEVNIEFGTSISPCLIKSIENNDYTYMILPIRLKED